MLGVVQQSEALLQTTLVCLFCMVTRQSKFGQIFGSIVDWLRLES